MDEAYFLALGFERWVSQLPFQTAMYVHRCVARDGARLYMAVPRVAPTADSSEELARLEAIIERFFSKHGGRRSEPVLEHLRQLA